MCCYSGVLLYCNVLLFLVCSALVRVIVSTCYCIVKDLISRGQEKPAIIFRAYNNIIDRGVAEVQELSRGQYGEGHNQAGIFRGQGK